MDSTFQVKKSRICYGEKRWTIYITSMCLILMLFFLFRCFYVLHSFSRKICCCFFFLNPLVLRSFALAFLPLFLKKKSFHRCKVCIFSLLSGKVNKQHFRRLKLVKVAQTVWKLRGWTLGETLQGWHFRDFSSLLRFHSGFLLSGHCWKCLDGVGDKLSCLSKLCPACWPVWLYWLGIFCEEDEVAGLIPSQGTHLGLWFGPQSGRTPEATDKCFSKIFF